MDKVLVVDDNAINRGMLSNILNGHFEVIEAENGETALKILLEDNSNIHAVLLDIVMPGIDGFQVLNEIRNNPKISELPVIIQTEKSDETFEMNALKRGATDFVSKPYKPQIILTRLENVINTRRMLNTISSLSADKLTGLMSLNQFYFEGENWIRENQDVNFDVVAIDIVRFNNINDSRGIEGGNQILIKVAEAIKEIRESTMFLASRVYADRFVLLVKRREGYRERLLAKADEITEKYKSKISIHFKLGIYEITDKEMKLPTICGRAFSATNLIKDYYGNKYAYYDDKLHELIVFEEHINDEMEKALKEKQFQVYFQPKYDLFTNSIAGAEALVRWIHPTDGLIRPDSFIPIFEKNGFIVKLDEYVWECTAWHISEWVRSGNKVVPVSVNISRIDLETIDVVDVLCKIIDKYSLAPELLHLEITETAYMEDTDKIISIVKELKERGFLIEMDDFGSGYSSLNMLAKLPINILKLDMKFVKEIESSSSAKTIIEYTIGLAKWMNLPVVAEGVETKEQLEMLKKLECNFVQGYVYAKPMPESEFEALLISDGADEKQLEDDRDLIIYETGKKHRMMIVEDLQLNRAVIRSYFEETFNIVEASNGQVAMDYLNQGNDVDIIILDIYMPQMNGYELLKSIRKDQKLKKIPVLVISAGTNEEEKKKSMELGADAFVSKPFTSESVIDRVRLLLRSEHVLDEMNIWDLKDTVENPWIKEICEDIAVIDIESGKICEVKGDSLVKTDNEYEQLISKETYENCMQQIEKNGKRFIAYKDEEYIFNAHLVVFDGKQYLICFTISIANAQKL